MGDDERQLSGNAKKSAINKISMGNLVLKAWLYILNEIRIYDIIQTRKK